MVAMTSFHTELCCHLVKHTPQHLLHSSSHQFLIYHTFVLVCKYISYVEHELPMSKKNVIVGLVGRDTAVWTQSWVLLPRAWSVCNDGSWRAVAAGRRHRHRTEHARSHTQVSCSLNYIIIKFPYCLLVATLLFIHIWILVLLWLWNMGVSSVVTVC